MTKFLLCLLRLMAYVCLFVVGRAFAYENVTTVVDNVLAPAGFFQNTLYVLCYTVGGGMLLGSLVLYHQHRKNPTQTRITQPLMMFFFGLGIALVPIIAGLSESAIGQ